MKLLLLHGRDQQGKNPKELKASWVNALEAGLRKNDLDLPYNLDIVFPYYGDLLEELVQSYELNTPRSKSLNSSAYDNPEDQFYHSLRYELMLNVDGTFEETNKERSKGILNSESVRFWASSFEKWGLGDKVLRAFAYDAYMYLRNQDIYQAIHAYLDTFLENDIYIVVGHSLGSAVGYNILHRHPQLQVKTYITLGLPLGLESFRTRIKQPVSHPPCLQGPWHNFYDERDLIALRRLDAKHFPVKPDVINYNHIQNHCTNRHGIEGYLDDPIVAKKIYEYL